MELKWHNAQMEQPTDPDVEVLVKVKRPFSEYAVARYDHSINSWVQYMCPINDPALKFQGGWIGFNKDDVIMEWAYISK